MNNEQQNINKIDLYSEVPEPQICRTIRAMDWTIDAFKMFFNFPLPWFGFLVVNIVFALFSLSAISISPGFYLIILVAKVFIDGGAAVICFNCDKLKYIDLDASLKHIKAKKKQLLILGCYFFIVTMFLNIIDWGIWELIESYAK